MSSPAETTAEPRLPLNRDRVLSAAIEVADEGGIEALTMRNLAQHLGVEAMSLYYHVENKAALLDGVVEVLVEEITEEVGKLDSPDPAHDWRTALRERILAARRVLLRHKWAPALIEQHSSMSLPVIMYFEGTLEILRKGGFSNDLAHHAMHALGSRALGFAQELFQPDDAAAEDASEEMLEQMAGQLPYLTGMLADIAHEGPDSTLGWCDDQTEFEFGLDVLLHGLQHRLTAIS